MGQTVHEKTPREEMMKTKKPKIKKTSDLWQCSQDSDYGEIKGRGKTPKEAYRNMFYHLDSKIKVLKGP